jgi:hypothetical protein
MSRGFAPGFSPQLRTAKDLVAKLEHDFGRVAADPHDAYAAFDFFVTAEHMGDWIGDLSLKKSNSLLALVSHLANGAKHMTASATRHRSARDVVDTADAFQRAAFQRDAFQVGGLVVEHDGYDGKAPGFVDVVTLADEVLAFWRPRV